jgi:hypothetical protein
MMSKTDMPKGAPVMLLGELGRMHAKLAERINVGLVEGE